MPVLDTNFLIAVHGGETAALEVLAAHQHEQLFVPDVVAAEFLTDWSSDADRAAILAALDADFSLCLPTREWILAAASLRAELRVEQRMVRTPDLWIATWSRHLATPVITQDKQIGTMTETIGW